VLWGSISYLPELGKDLTHSQVKPTVEEDEPGLVRKLSHPNKGGHCLLSPGIPTPFSEKSVNYRLVPMHDV
jgi:hypothetical protein